MNIKLSSAVITGAIVATTLSMSQAFAGERPPTDSKPLAEIITSLEQQGYSPITEISMDDGMWEVEAYKDNQARELKVDPKDGKVISDRLDD